MAWKKADVVAIPKQKPVKDINNYLCPISLTLIISKLAEDFVVNNYLKPAVMESVDDKQFGTVPNSSTTYALISMLTWLKDTGGSGSTTRSQLQGIDLLWKYVDYTTMSESVAKNNPSLPQNYVDEFVTKSQSHGLQLKESKCEKLSVVFSKSSRTFQPIHMMNNKSIDVVQGRNCRGGLGVFQPPPPHPLPHYSRRAKTERSRTK